MVDLLLPILRGRLTLNFVQVAFLIFGQQVSVCIFPGVDFPHKYRLKPAVLSVSAAGYHKSPANREHF